MDAPTLGWARVIGGWYLAIALAPLIPMLSMAQPPGGGTVVGCALLGVPALGLVVAPRRFIRLTIAMVSLLVGLSLPVSLATSQRWVALVGFGLLAVPLAVLIGIRRRMLVADDRDRVRERLDDLAPPAAAPGQPAPPPTLPEIP